MKNWIVCGCLLLLFNTSYAQNSVTATPLTPTSPAVYRIDVTFDLNIQPDTEFEIIFPSEFSLLKVMMANSKVLGGSLELEVVDNKVRLSNSKRKNVASQTLIDFMIASVINAKDMTKVFTFTVNVLQNGEIAEEKNIETRVELLNR